MYEHIEFAWSTWNRMSAPYLCYGCGLCFEGWEVAEHHRRYPQQLIEARRWKERKQVIKHSSASVFGVTKWENEIELSLFPWFYDVSVSNIFTGFLFKSIIQAQISCRPRLVIHSYAGAQSLRALPAPAEDLDWEPSTHRVSPIP